MAKNSLRNRHDTFLLAGGSGNVLPEIQSLPLVESSIVKAAIPASLVLVSVESVFMRNQARNRQLKVIRLKYWCSLESSQVLKAAHNAVNRLPLHAIETSFTEKKLQGRGSQSYCLFSVCSVGFDSTLPT